MTDYTNDKNKKHLITVGIIDRDEEGRKLTSLTLKENANKNKDISIELLFELDKRPHNPVILIPDVLIIDIEHQDSSCVEETRNAFPGAQIIILTNIAEVKAVRSCFRNGAVGYLLKQTCMSSLVQAIATTMNGGSFVSPRVNRALIEQSFNGKKCEDLLTARELQIANGIVEGLSYKMIAQKYAISLDTVRIYIKRIYRKLQINSKGELIARLTA